MSAHDKEYVKRIAVNDQSAIAAFYDDTYPKFVSYFRKKYGKTVDYSKDLFQEAYMAMYDNILRGKLTDESLKSSLYQYLLGIAIRMMQAMDRKSHELDRISLYSQNGSGEGDLDVKVRNKLLDISDAEQSERKSEELKDFVGRMIVELNPPCSELLKHFYWERLSGSEIAEVMNYSNADSVKTQKNKCMKKLKPIVAQFRKL